MTTPMDMSIYKAAGGRPAFHALALAWHRRCLADPMVSHAFSHGDLHRDHTARLAAYWVETLGGPPDYTSTFGDESHVLRLHSGNGKHREMDESAQVCFAQALDDAGLPDDDRLRATLRDWFRWATAEMARHPDSAEDVPSGVPMPHWTWDGPA